jgi:uncharacterized protein
MTSEERDSYIDYRMESAYKTFDAARLLADNKYWNSAVNRLYYSFFYAVNALLFKNNILAKSHSSTKTLFSQNFIKAGIFDKKYGRLLAQLLDWRQKADYTNICDYSEDFVEPMFDQVKEIIDLIDKEVRKK